jgi:hypothetical protein
MAWCCCYNKEKGNDDAEDGELTEDGELAKIEDAHDHGTHVYENPPSYICHTGYAFDTRIEVYGACGARYGPTSSRQAVLQSCTSLANVGSELAVRFPGYAIGRIQWKRRGHMGSDWVDVQDGYTFADAVSYFESYHGDDVPRNVTVSIAVE